MRGWCGRCPASAGIAAPSSRRDRGLAGPSSAPTTTGRTRSAGSSSAPRAGPGRWTTSRTSTTGTTGCSRSGWTRGRASSSSRSIRIPSPFGPGSGDLPDLVGLYRIGRDAVHPSGHLRRGVQLEGVPGERLRGVSRRDRPPEARRSHATADLDLRAAWRALRGDVQPPEHRGVPGAASDRRALARRNGRGCTTSGCTRASSSS